MWLVMVLIFTYTFYIKHVWYKCVTIHTNKNAVTYTCYLVILSSCLESSRSFLLSLLTFPFGSGLNAELFWCQGWNPVIWEFPRFMSLVKQTGYWTLMFVLSYSSNLVETCLSKDKVLFAGVCHLQQSSTHHWVFFLCFLGVVIWLLL